MSNKTTFATSHNNAFLALGALAPGQQWSAFDVSRDQARAGKATLFVTTIWNFHSTLDEKGHRLPNELAIVKDREEGSFWYRVSRPNKGTTRKTWVAHWHGLELAVSNSLPIIGVLKDVHTSRCSLDNIFDCTEVRTQVDGSAAWLKIVPRSELGFDFRLVDVHQLVLQGDTVSELVAINLRFEDEVRVALSRSSEQRKLRLETAARLPKRIQVTSTVFYRNSDVVAEALFRANGICERCASSAPFLRRSDRSPYLEVHHRTPLSVGGEDTVENAIALCPNCHRNAHYG